MRTYCVAQGTLLRPLWWPNGEGNLKKSGFIFMNNWFTLLYSEKLIQQCKAAVFLLFTHQGVWLFCDPMDCSLLLCPWNFPGKILERVTIYFSRRSSQPRDWTHVSCIGRWIFYHWATREAQSNYTPIKINLKRKMWYMYIQWNITQP